MQIHLRSLQEKDAVNMMEWMTDPFIICFFRFDATNVSIDSCLSFIRKSTNDRDCRHYAIVDEKDEYLGTISLKNINTVTKDAEYAISTRCCAHGTGAAGDATKEILLIAFKNLGLEKVYLNVLEDNLRANAFYRKVGFKFERMEKNALEIRGKSRNLNWYSMSKNDYLEKME